MAPSPTGYLHVGHAMTFWRAQERATSMNGAMLLRIEDLDPQRCRDEFRGAALEDLRWFGLRWEEGPDVSGPHQPYLQSERRSFYLQAWRRLHQAGLVYPCRCSRKDVLQAAVAPHEEDEEPIYPGTCRPESDVATVVAAALSRGECNALAPRQSGAATEEAPLNPSGMHWRFRVPDSEEIFFCDQRLGGQRAVAGKDFGDFVVWRTDDVPAYQLAVVVDDAAMGITEVVRGEDLLTSTFRQLLLYRALGYTPPQFFHTPLITDQKGKRLAKRHASLSLRELRKTGLTPDEIRGQFL
jgi:glutamyl-tRNA synthetase